MSSKYDLHSHSWFSDGTLSPDQLIQAALAAEVTHLALTDHDTVDGLQEAERTAQASELTLISGIEFSCTWQNQLVHVVGLNIYAGADSIAFGVAQNKQRRSDRAEAMHAALAKRNIDVRDAVDAQLQSNAAPTRPHFAQALIDGGYVKDMKRAFKQYLTPGKPGYVPMQWPSIEEVGGWIRDAGGIAVLAHPNRYKFTRTRLIRLLEDMKNAGIEAMEVSTCSTDKPQSAMLAQLARDHGLLASLGSDFHSPEQPWARLGSAAALPDDLTPVWDQF